MSSKRAKKGGSKDSKVGASSADAVVLEEEQAPKRQKQQKQQSVYEVNVGLRGPVYTDDDSFCTIKVDVLVTAKVKSDIELIDLRDRLTLLAAGKSIAVDKVRGMLFTATGKKSLKMAVLDSDILLREAFSKTGTPATRDRVIVFGLGATPADYDPTEHFVGSQDSQKGVKGLRSPPNIRASDQKGEGVKAAAKASTESIHACRAFLEDCYHSPNSPLHHAFHRYLFGVMYSWMRTKEAEGESLMTDIAHGVYPSLSDMNKYSPDGSWTTPIHINASQGFLFKLDAYPPDKDGEIPMADLCKMRAGAPAAASAEDGKIDEVLKMMRSAVEMSALGHQHAMQQAAPAAAAAAPPVITPAPARTGTGADIAKLLEKIDVAEEIKRRAQASDAHAGTVEKQDKKITRYLLQIEQLQGSSEEEEDNEE
ncbi:hypothetical protein B484DRAFT_402178 [Ochromonadaceae sp. CCMP2298]|nr:hypothetical protein B484DRAFT_402178 [Ochromonadaceae sp. CCMP2298]